MSDELTHTFNWIEEDRRGSSVFSMLLPTVIMGEDFDEIAEELADKTDKWTNVEVTMQINGVPVAPMKFFDKYTDQHERFIGDKAKELIKETLDDGLVDFTAILRSARVAFLQQLEKAGIPVSEDDYYGY